MRVHLHDDLKLAELTATTLGTLRQVRSMQRRQDALRNFFAPVALDALAGTDPSEEGADRLLELLNRISNALGVMTHHILASGGVFGDFHGHAAMGFWGWPIASEHSRQAACEAAFAI